MWRGAESTGLALIRHGKEKELPEVYKDSLPASDFCRRPWVERAFHHMDDYSIAIGHTRSATRGLNLIAKNAHPFQYNFITLVHNGTIDNAYDIIPHLDRPNDVTVDSDIITLAMGRLGPKEDEKVVLEKLRGAFALVWHNTRDGSLNIARNDRKPLFFCYLKNENSMFWTSEYTLLCHLLERRGLKIEGKVSYPEPQKWYKFFIKDLRRWSSAPFEFRPQYTPIENMRDIGGTSRNGHTTPNRNTTDYRDATPEELEELRSQIRTASQLDIDDEKTIKEWLRQRGTPSLKHSGMPSTVKKIQQAARSLRDLGFAFNQAHRMTPNYWQPYKKNKEKLGQLHGTSINGSPMIMHNVLRTSWDKYLKFGKVFVSCINTRKMDNGKVAVVCVEHPRHEARMEEFFRNGAETENSTTLNYFGPSGQKVSREKFLELVKEGCSYCTGDLTLQDHVSLLWVGDPKRPVCRECASNPEFWKYMGVNPNGNRVETLN